MGGQFPGSIWNPSPHFWNGHSGQKVKYIIVHGTAGFSTAQQVANFFHNDNPPTSVHYIVGRDGTVVQCVHESDSAWGNGVISRGADKWWTGNPNWYTFSIEHVKTDPANAENLTAAQQSSSFWLIAYLCNKYGIPRRPANSSGGITGHYSIDPVNRSFCPGTYPWNALFKFLGDPVSVTGAPNGGGGGGPSATGGSGSGGSGGGNTTGLTDPLAGTGGGSGSGGFDVSGFWSFLTGIFPWLNSSWLQNIGWNLLKIVLGILILSLVLIGLIINIIGSDVLGIMGGSGKGAGKALATFAAIA